LLQIFLHFEDVVQKIGVEVLFILLLLGEYLQVFEVLEGIAFVAREVVFNTAVPPEFLLLSVGSLLPLAEKVRPGCQVEQLSELKFSTPEVLTQSTKIAFAKRRLIEEHLVLVVINPHDGSIVAEEARRNADDDVSDLMVERLLPEVEVAELAQSMREEEIRIDLLYFGLFLFVLWLFGSLISAENLFELADSLEVDLLRVKRTCRHVCLFHLDQPLVHFHQSLGRHSRVYLLSIDGLIPFDLLPCVLGPLDDVLVPFLHEFKHFWEFLFVFDQYLQGTN
jgi:hypothetical protein